MLNKAQHFPGNNENHEDDVKNGITNMNESIPEDESDTALDQVISFEDENVNIERQAEIPEGQYEFKINDIRYERNAPTQYGFKNRYNFQFQLTGASLENVALLVMKYNVSTDARSNLMKLMQSFKEVFRGKKIKIGELKGLTGEATVSHVKTEEGNIFENLDVIHVNPPANEIN